MRPSILAIAGPTAVGKSAVAEALAVALGGELISADSMQIYRGMDIGTAKTPPADRLVSQHLIDIVEPGTPYSAALYQADARGVIASLTSRGVLPVLVGGTGLYIRAALDDMTFPPGDSQTPVRREIEMRADMLGPEALYAELRACDPSAAALIHPNNVKRVIRALEMHAEGASYAVQAANFSRRTFRYPGTVLVGLTMDRAELYRRIDARVDAMLAQGLLAEVESLLARGLRGALTAAQAIGYKEIVPVLEGDSSLQEARAAIQQASRRYAKRQLSWFRADPRIAWVDVTGLTAADAASTVLDLLQSNTRSHPGGDSCV